MKTAIRDDSPVVIFEDKMMYRVKGPVPEDDYTIPFGVAEIKRAGTDVTIVATSSMVAVALGAAKMLDEIGISAEVIDPRTTWPLDKQALIDSAKKTSRAIVVDEGYERYGVTAEIAVGDRRRRVLPPRRAGEAHRAPWTCRCRSRRCSRTSRCRPRAAVFEAAKALCGKA